MEQYLSQEQIAYNEASEYLIDLLRAYGHRSVIVKHNADGEPVEVMARSFVKRQLTKAGIVFPLNSGLKPIDRPFNHALDREKLTILFHEALFGLEEAYVDLNCQSPRADHYVNTIYEWINRKYEWIIANFPAFSKDELDPFPEPTTEDVEKKEVADAESIEKARLVLKELGVKKIESVIDINAIFWNLAFHHKPITKSMRSAIVELSIDQTLAKKILAANSKAFNTQIASLSEGYVDKESEQKITSLKQQMEKVAQEKNDYRRKLGETRTSMSGYKKVVKRLFKLIANPTSDFYKTYNLELDEDQELYIKWFMVLKKKVTNGLMKDIAKYWVFSEEALERFRTKVNEYNETIIEVEETDETE